MEALSKEVVAKWVKKHDWMKINEAATPTGRQHMFLTPSGGLIAVMYDLKGDILGFAQPMPAPQSPLNIPGLKR